MTITTTTRTFFQSQLLPCAPEREDISDAEADEQRGRELRAYLELLTTLDESSCMAAQDVVFSVVWDREKSYAWEIASNAAWVAKRGGAWESARMIERDLAREGAWDAAGNIIWFSAGAAMAIVARDLIPEEHFDTLSAPMRAAGIDFDALL